MQFRNHWIVAVFVIAGLQLAACTGTTTAPSPHEKPSVVDKEQKTVKLSQKAHDRLGVETTKVTEEQVTRKRKVGGEVVGASKVASSTSSSSGGLLVRVNLNTSDVQAMDRKQPIHVMAIDSDDEDEVGEDAEMDDANDSESDSSENSPTSDDADKPVYFKLKSNTQGLKEGQRALIAFALQGKGSSHKLIPYSAVLYDVKGAAWVYINTEPLVYKRQPISVDYIQGQMAYLSEGPSAGTLVVTRGAAELYGAETGVGK